jgi:hypothetical protein
MLFVYETRAVAGARACAHNTKICLALLGELHIFSGQKEHSNWEEAPYI